MKQKRKTIKAGDVFPSTSGETVLVLEYLTCHKVRVEVQDEHLFATTVTARALRNGRVPNPFRKTVAGLGFTGVGNHAPSHEGKLLPSYLAWDSMFTRCYSDSHHDRFPAYRGCTVHPDWHDYQVFAEWYNRQPKKLGVRLELDKDLKVIGNKVYGPEYCSLVPAVVNNLLIDRSAGKRTMLQGVRRAPKGTYQSCLSRYGVQVHLGTFNCPWEAFLEYKKAKESYVREVAMAYQEFIDVKVYENLMNWEVPAPSEEILRSLNLWESPTLLTSL